MSVYEARRKESSVEFIRCAREFRKVTIQILKKFPTSYRWMITNNMLELAGDVYTNAVRANAIYLSVKTREKDFELRHRYLMMANTATEALLSEISFCYDLVKDGNNFLGNRDECARKFNYWTEAGYKALKRIRGVIASDNKRWDGYRNKA